MADILNSLSGLNGVGRNTGQVLNLYKNLGETPRERLERLRKAVPHYEHEVLSYAGRLDPMAEGVMLCLVGSANKRREAYLDMSKEYTLDILFGFSTDTYDVLGRVMDWGDVPELNRQAIQYGLNEFRGEVSQEYPPFSSKTLEGKPLFQWARQGALAAMVLPKRVVTIFDITLRGLYKIGEADLLSYIEDSVGKVNGDFRQEEIVGSWKKYLKTKGQRQFACATVTISCSSGTYARSLAHGLGAHIGCPTLALHILRTKVGDYDISRSIR